jgi:hypothetical protein
VGEPGARVDPLAPNCDVAGAFRQCLVNVETGRPVGANGGHSAAQGGWGHCLPGGARRERNSKSFLSRKIAFRQSMTDRRRARRAKSAESSGTGGRRSPSARPPARPAPARGRRGGQARRRLKCCVMAGLCPGHPRRRAATSALRRRRCRSRRHLARIIEPYLRWSRVDGRDKPGQDDQPRRLAPLTPLASPIAMP